MQKHYGTFDVESVWGHGEGHRLLCVSRIEERKNLPTLLEALSRTKCNVRLIIAGAGKDSEYGKEILEYCEDNLVLGQVEFIGALSSEKLSALMKSANLLVHPAEVEAFGMVLVESLLEGTPVLCSSSLTKEITQLPGVVTFDQHLVSLECTLGEMLDSSAWMLALSENASSNISMIGERFSWDRFGREVIELALELEKVRVA